MWLGTAGQQWSRAGHLALRATLVGENYFKKVRPALVEEFNEPFIAAEEQPVPITSLTAEG